MSRTTSDKKRPADSGGRASSKKAKVQGNALSQEKAWVPASEKRPFEEQPDDFADFDESRPTYEAHEHENEEIHPSRKTVIQQATQGKDGVLNGQSSREAHAKQRALAAERRNAKPNADSIARTKKIWERLRIKSSVPKEERDTLVKELFSIITGRVKDFVFKHDSVRVIQCALKYATPEQKRQIATELRGSYRELAESKYAKFLIAKMVVGDNEIRDMVVPEFYGHVKRLMRHPEASWIMDDIYRGLATKEQKAMLLREWYGPEFTMFHNERNEKISADLSTILTKSPEKRGPIMQHLKEMTNQLVQKKTTGFTMLHDALLQYFLNVKPGSPEATEFLDMLKDDEEGDLYKNLAFTKSGSRLVCLTLALGNSKDRRAILKFFKTHIKLLSGDSYGHLVLLAAFEVIDDTVMTAKAVFPELLSKDLSEEERTSELLGQAQHLTARIPLLYLLAPEPQKWLITDDDLAIINEIRDIRKDTSKKDPETRRVELVKAMSQPLIDLVGVQAGTLVASSFGCQFVAEVLLGAIGDKGAALAAVVSLAEGDAAEDGQLLSTPHAGRMLKTLVQGGRFDKVAKQTQLVDPPLQFHDLLYEQIASSKPAVLRWATGPNSFTVVAMLEAPDFEHRSELENLLRGHKDQLANRSPGEKATNAGTKIILDKIGGIQIPERAGNPRKSKVKK